MPDDIIPISKYASYQAEVVADIEARVQELGCQPILFVGSGFSKWYFGGSDNVRSPSRGRVSRSVKQDFRKRCLPEPGQRVTRSVRYDRN